MLIRIITDGKAGDLVQCLGVAEQVIALAGGSIEERMVRPRFLYSLAMPWGPADPRDAAAAAEPYPDIAIASGRRAVASIRLLKRRAPGCFTVFLKDPRTGPSSADLIWVPAHDRLRGPNVVTSMTSPHRITTEKLNAASAGVRADILRVAKPRVAVLVGGASRDVAFERSDRQRLLSDLIQLARSGAGLMVTPSRRTPAEFVAQLQEALVPLGAWIWDGQGDNPYLELLALADHIDGVGRDHEGVCKRQHLQIRVGTLPVPDPG